MKTLFVVLLAWYANAEPPPYAPSGFRPAGEPFTLPPSRFSHQQPAAFAPQTQYGAPPTPQGGYLPPQTTELASVKPLQESGAEEQYVPPRPFGQQAFRPRQQRFQYDGEKDTTVVPNVEGEIDNFNPPRKRVRGQRRRQQDSDDGVLRRPFRRRKQQSGDDSSGGFEASGQNNTPANAYGAPTNSPVGEPESTTRPTKRVRTTTVRPNEEPNEEDNDTSGPNVSIATAFAARYYVLQPDGQLQEIQYKPTQQLDGNLRESGENLAIISNKPFVEPAFGYSVPVIRLD